MIPLEDGTDWSPTDEQVAQWKWAYPQVDVDAELRKAAQWCVDNPSRRKTLRGIARYVGSWLGRCDSERGRPRRNPAPIQRHGGYVEGETAEDWL